jgi:hypothetical protein
VYPSKALATKTVLRLAETSPAGDSGFRVQDSGFRVQGSGFRVQGSGFRVQGSGFEIIIQRDSLVLTSV